MILIIAMMAHLAMNRSPRRRACADVVPNLKENNEFLQNADPEFWRQVDPEFVTDEDTSATLDSFQDTQDFSNGNFSMNGNNVTASANSSVSIALQPVQPNGRRLQQKKPAKSIPAGAVVISSEIVVFDNASWRRVIFLHNGFYQLAIIYLAKFVLMFGAFEFKPRFKGRRPIVEPGVAREETPDEKLRASKVAYFYLRDSFAFPDLETLIRCRPDLKNSIPANLTATIPT
jgi:hypothetical protein